MNEKDWTDWLVLVISIISPIIGLASVIYAAKAAKAAKNAADLNIEMYIEQKEEREKSFLPVFEIQGFHSSNNYISFELININDKSVSFTNFGGTRPKGDFLYEYDGDNKVSFTIYDNFAEKDFAKVTVYYNTLNHKVYSSLLTLRLIDQNLIIEDHSIVNRT
jgi:hypothetical protein